ncbi:hypothetical protein BACCOPRO_02375 [Phocaeicola coprophilus DSM 18228 = JCM 13818]|uniref:Uncharacterized protein n=1 Tax=Phocaeicola coprophilus DSM 18228 = JCM 13818 TaxID=547042 RepID=S0F916_9BACT|nr:hypothetical protein BACCOPRO_02375 [Phocaeicola coprophilus DSM 18228 = JCM 13818]
MSPNDRTIGLQRPHNPAPTTARFPAVMRTEKRMTPVPLARRQKETEVIRQKSFRIRKFPKRSRLSDYRFLYIFS